MKPILGIFILAITTFVGATVFAADHPVSSTPSDDMTALGEMGAGASISISTQSKIIHPTEWSMSLGKISMPTTGAIGNSMYDVECEVIFPQSAQDRSFPGGRLEISDAQINEYRTAVSNGADIAGQFRLNGATTPITDLFCMKSYLNAGNQPVYGRDISIGEFRKYLAVFGGTLNLAPAIPF